MMRPIINFACDAVDNDDPFPPVQKPTQPITAKRQVSHFRSAGTSAVASSATRANSLARFGGLRKGGDETQTGNKGGSKQPLKNTIAKSNIPKPRRLSNGSSVRSILSTPGGTPSRQPTPFNEDKENNIGGGGPRQQFTDSMFAQALKESNIDLSEKKMKALIDSMLPARQNVTQLLLNGRQIEPELTNRLRDLSVEISVDERELVIRRAFLQKARDTFVRKLADYSSLIDTKLEAMERKGEQYRELVASIERSALTGPELAMKPVMIDKEVQAIPERTLLRSPTAEMDFTSSRITQLPASPVLRTTANKPKPPSDHPRTEATPRKILF